MLALCVGALCVAAERLRPGFADGGDGLRELAGDSCKLSFHRAEQLVVQVARFAGNSGHGRRDDRLDGFCRDRCAVPKTGLE